MRKLGKLSPAGFCGYHKVLYRLMGETQQQSHPVVNPMSYKNGQYGKICPWAH